MANVSSFSGAMPVIPGGTVELGYSQITSNVSVASASTGTGATTVIAPVTVVCDGGPVLVEFFAANAAPSTTSGDFLAVSLMQDGAEAIRYWTYKHNNSGGPTDDHLYLSRRLTPSAGSHTFGVNAFVTSAARPGKVNASASTSGDGPAFLRVSKIVNQNDGLKPFWTPPVVTQLPSQATVGDQVIYAADATNGVYWHLQYDGLGTYPWKFIGGAPLLNTVVAGESTASSSYVALTTAGPQITVPVAGDYDVLIGCNFNSGTGNDIPGAMSFLVGGTAASDDDAVWMQTRGPGYNWTNSRPSRKTGISASTALVARYKSPAGAGMIFGQRFMRVTPIRVSA